MLRRGVTEARTPWLPIAAVLLAGIAAAAQLGKVPAAMTTIGAEFGLGLAAAALVVALFGLLAALGGLAIGLAAARIGARRALLAGAAIAAGAAFAAAIAPGFPTLLAARVAEGAGFLLLTVAAPGLIAGAAQPRDRAFAMALWGTYMPAGIALGLLGAPVVEAAGWRAAWLGYAALLAAAGAACLVLAPAAPPASVAREPIAAQLRGLVGARRPLLIALSFGSYNVVYVGIAAFLPARLEYLGEGTGAAGLAGAVAAVANALGNLAGGVLMRRGFAPALLTHAAAPVMAVLAASVFVLPGATLATLAAIAACSVGGLVPASLFALLPGSVPRAALAAPAVGLVIQGNNIAQLLAPPLIGALAGQAWALAAGPVLLCGLVSALAARRLR
jgi:MFS family permease